MEKETISKLNKTFEECAYEKDGVEYWLARDLQELLDYTQWRNFLNVIEKVEKFLFSILKPKLERISIRE